MNWAYIAGFFDGEGSISQCTGKICWTIAIAQADRSVLETIACFLDSHDITTGISIHHPKGIQKRTVYILYTRGRKNCRVFIKATLPYLQVKKTTMQDVLRFLTMYGNLGLYQRFLVKPPRPRGLASCNGKKTHCPNGHEYSEKNTWTSKRGSRACRTCNRLRARSARTQGGRLSGTQSARARL